MKQVSWMCPFVPTVTCERCGESHAMVGEWTWGLIGKPLAWLWFTAEHKLWILRCEISKWWHRNDPPPF